uniref:DNA/RNA-binding protein Alba-like domain-containing protein n=1 Tax=Zea mays TaxID=4577 RepID=A0A804RFE3_MAIZE
MTHLEDLRTVAAAGTLPQAVRQRAARQKLTASAPARTVVRAGCQGRQDRQRTVEGPDDKGSYEVVFKAMGRAINKTVMVVELIKRRIVGLHQNTTTGSTDMWEPLEECLLLLETTRHVSMITITLSKKEVDTSSIGYQSPLPADEVKPLVKCDTDEGIMHTHLVAVEGVVVVEAVGRAGAEVDVEMGSMSLLMLVGKTITPLHIWEMDMPVEEVAVSGVVAGEAATITSLNTNRTEVIKRRHLFMLQL